MSPNAVAWFIGSERETWRPRLAQILFVPTSLRLADSPNRSTARSVARFIACDRQKTRRSFEEEMARTLRYLVTVRRASLTPSRSRRTSAKRSSERGSLGSSSSTSRLICCWIDFWLTVPPPALGMPPEKKERKGKIP